MVLCLLTLLHLAGAASWLYGMTPPPDSPDLGAPGAWLCGSSDNNPFNEEDCKTQQVYGRRTDIHPAGRL